MSNVKTAISVRDVLFKQAEQIASEMKISRSGLFSLALEEFVQRYKNRQLLAQINNAYSEGPDQEEAIRQQKMRRLQRELVEGEWT
jgi:metal-responsive CopG/Arc/MetJ family transcriptional regulator